MLVTWMLAVLPGAALAQTTVRGSECKPGAECTAGDYRVKLTLNQTSFNTTDEYFLTVDQLTPLSADWRLEVDVIPSRGTSATTVKFTDDNGDRARRQMKIHFPIGGSWTIQVIIQGQLNNGYLRLPATVEAPPKLPDWLAWAIGLSPLIGLIGFAIGQWRLIVRRKRAVRLAQAESESSIKIPLNL
jgi:hypothetical protein